MLHYLTGRVVFFLSLLFIVIYLYFFRAHYFAPFYPQYLHDYYTHSQWVVPQSARVLGDEWLYAFAGYRLLHGAKLYSIAPEVPPLGLYLIGLSQIVFGRSLGFVPFVFALTIFGFYLLTGFFFTRRTIRYVATLLFLAVPTFVVHIYRITLDLLQVCVLLFHIYFLFRSVLSAGWRMWFFAFLSGCMSGMFISFKFGLFIIPIFIADVVFLYLSRRLRLFFVILFMTPCVYFFSTFAYFLQGGDFGGWLSAQKWIVHFYLQSRSSFFPGMVFITLLSGLYKGWWWGGEWKFVEDWSFVMSLGLIVFVVYLFLLFLRRGYFSLTQIYVLVYTSCALLLLSGITFWPRYMILLVPFLVLFFVSFVERSARFSLLFLFFFVISFLQTSFLFFRQPTYLTKAFEYNYVHGLFADLYHQFHPASAPFDYVSFSEKMWQIQKTLGVYSREVRVTHRFVMPWESEVFFPARISYITDIGALNHTFQLHLKKHHGAWAIVWDWQYVLPLYDDGVLIDKQRIDGKQGVLRTIDGAILTHGGERTFVFVVFSLVPDFDALEGLLAEPLGVQRFFVRKKILEIAPYLDIVPVGFFVDGISSATVSAVCHTRGILCRDIPDRVVDSAFHSRDVRRVRDLEYRFRDRLFAHHGGSVTLVFPDGTRHVIFSRQARDGEDVVVDVSNL